MKATPTTSRSRKHVPSTQQPSIAQQWLTKNNSTHSPNPGWAPDFQHTQERSHVRNDQKNDRLSRHGIPLARPTEQRTDERLPHAAMRGRLPLLQPQAVRKIRRQGSEGARMSRCHYCRDAATTTAGGRDVCGDCRAAYERQVTKQAEEAKREITSN